MEHRQELRMRTAQRIQERAMPSTENFMEQQRLHHESVMRRQMLLEKLRLAQNRVAEISGRRKIKANEERPDFVGHLRGGLRGGNWWDVFDPNKNGVANAFDPNKNGIAQGITDIVKKVENEFTNPDSVLARGVTDTANKVANEFTNPNSVLRAGTEDAMRRLDNEFTNPDSVMRRGVENAFDPNKNGVGVAFQKVANEFDNPNSDFRRGVGAAAEVLKSTLEGPVKNFLQESFDPNRNGLGDAFRKFGRETEAAFQEFGNKMASAFSKEEMERTFAPLKSAFEKFGNATDTWFKSVDPMVWIIVASSVLTIAGTIASFGLAGPALVGANAALISAAGAAVTIGGKAALGRQIDPTDVAGLVLGLLPVPGVSVAAGQGANAVMRALSAVGQTAAGMSKAQVALAGAKAINGIAAAQQSLPGGVNLSIGFGKHGRRGKGMTMDFAQKIANLTKAEILDDLENDAEAELTGGAFNWGDVFDPNKVYIGGTPGFYNPRPIQDFTPMPQPYDPYEPPMVGMPSRPRPRPVYDGMNYTGGTPYDPNTGMIRSRRGEPFTEYSPTSNAGFGGKKGGGLYEDASQYLEIISQYSQQEIKATIKKLVKDLLGEGYANDVITPFVDYVMGSLSGGAKKQTLGEEAWGSLTESWGGYILYNALYYLFKWFVLTGEQSSKLGMGRKKKGGIRPPHMRHEGTENNALRQLYDLRGR